jgi:SagB-type dehydrogenase family enzyme
MFFKGLKKKEQYMTLYKEGLAFRYIQGTKYHRDKPLKDHLGSIPASQSSKNYPDTERFQLPQPDLNRSADLWQCMKRRRSERVTARAGIHLLRTAPSAGALYPFETYVYVDHVEDVPQGLYHLDVANFALERLKEGSFSKNLTTACLGQPAVRRAAVVFIWTAMMLRCMVKYRNRAMRYIPMDLGHVCQNVQLASTAMNLGSCPIGAFFDDDINRLLGVDGEDETVLYLVTVGKL